MMRPVPLSVHPACIALPPPTTPAFARDEAQRQKGERDQPGCGAADRCAQSCASFEDGWQLGEGGFPARRLVLWWQAESHAVPHDDRTIDVMDSDEHVRLGRRLLACCVARLRHVRLRRQLRFIGRGGTVPAQRDRSKVVRDIAGAERVGGGGGQ